MFDAPKGDALALPTAKLADLGAMRKKDQLTQSALYKGPAARAATAHVRA